MRFEVAVLVGGGLVRLVDFGCSPSSQIHVDSCFLYEYLNGTLWDVVGRCVQTVYSFVIVEALLVRTVRTLKR